MPRREDIIGFLGPFGQWAEAKDPPAASEGIKKKRGTGFKVEKPASPMSIIDNEGIVFSQKYVRADRSNWLKHDRFIVQE